MTNTEQLLKNYLSAVRELDRSHPRLNNYLSMPEYIKFIEAKEAIINRDSVVEMLLLDIAHNFADLTSASQAFQALNAMREQA